MDRHRLPRRYSKAPWLLLLLLGAVLALMVVLRQKGDDNPLAPQHPDGVSGDTLNVAVLYSPMTYYLYQDTIGGLSYDLLQQMSDDLGMPLRFFPVMSLEDALQNLEQGNYRMLAALAADQETRNRFLVTNPVYTDRLMLVQKRLPDGRLAVSSSLDLANDTVHLEKDSPAVTRLRNLCREIGDTIYLQEHAELSQEYLLLKVASGEYRYAVVNELTAQRLMPTHPELSADTQVSFTQNQSWLLQQKDSLLLGRINHWLDSLKRSPAYPRITSRYITPARPRQ